MGGNDLKYFSSVKTIISMIFLLHQNGVKFIKAFSNNHEIKVKSGTCTDVFWELVYSYPKEFVIWCEESFYPLINRKKLRETFQHNLVMASSPINNQFIPDSIGYIDQLPFINPKYDVQYPTWRMSTDCGGIKGETALQFNPYFKKIKNFGNLINSIAKFGQQNSLLCYCVPGMVNEKKPNVKIYQATQNQLFAFVATHYRKRRIFSLFLCFLLFEQKIPFFSLWNNLFLKSKFKNNVDLRLENFKSLKKIKKPSLDVIIPTLGREDFIENLLKDLSVQTLLPDNVFIIEQASIDNSKSQLKFLEHNEWPFSLNLIFTNVRGACHARNIGLRATNANFLFLCDDDNRLNKNVIQDMYEFLIKWSVDVVNTNYPQPGEKQKFFKVKQWGVFGSGNSLLRRNIKVKEVFFDTNFEGGYGEDIDYGMQLRLKGIDVLFNPHIDIFHLKGSTGGFRAVPDTQSKEICEPKPSPTRMLFVRKYYSDYMQRGYKLDLFIKYYFQNSITNPVKYYRWMLKRWRLSEKLAGELLNTDQVHDK